MTATISPPMFTQFLNPNNTGSPASGFKLFTYVAGTNTKQATWTDSTQSVQNANPLILDSSGGGYVFGDPTVPYKFVWAPANDTDPPSSPIRSVDNLYFPLSIAVLTQAVIGQILFPETAAEIAAGATPTNYAYPPGNALRYGADPTGSSDSAAAIQKALNGNSLCYLPHGVFSVSAVTMTSNMMIQGSGIGVTQIYARNASNDVFTVTGSGCTFRDFFMSAGPTRTGGRFIYFTNTSSLGIVEDVYMLGWYFGISLNGTGYDLRALTLKNGVASAGQGIRVGAEASPSNCSDISIINVNIDNPSGAKPDSGVLVVSCGDVSMIDCELQHCTFALSVKPGTSQVATSIRAVNSFFDNAGTYGVFCQPQSVSGAIIRMCLTTCWASSAGTHGMLFDTNTVGGTIDGVSIVDAECFLNGTDGIRLAGTGTTNVSITGGKFAGNGNNGVGILANVGKFSIQGGRFGPCGAISANGGNGIQVLAGTADEYIIAHNDCTGNTVAGVVDAGTGTHKVIEKNLPFGGAIPVTVTASPFTWNNNTGATVTLMVIGGTVSSVTLGGSQVAAATNTSVSVPQGYAVVITYSSTPTVSYLGT